MANSLVFHIMLKKGSEVPKFSVQLKFIGAGSNTKHLGLSRSYLPHPNSKSCATFFMDFLFFKEYFVKFSNFFLNRLDRSPKFQFSSSSLELV